MLTKVFIKMRKVIVFVTIYAFLFSSLPARAYLPPISNAQMYTLATQGNVRALRAAIQRGLNIDTLDRYGNTALCHAIIQRNYTAYNALRAAGANPYHPCVRNIREGYYDSFLSSRRVVPTTANSREAYAYMGEEDFLFSSATWWTLGTILLGGALVLILGGGGGGSDGVYLPSYPTTDYSLGSIAGTWRPAYPADYPYDPVILQEQDGGTLTNGSGPDYNLGGDNPDGWVISNDSSVVVNDETQKLTDLIDFNHSALDYGNYIQAAMKGIYGSTVNNGYDINNPRYDPSKEYIITLGNNTTALVALSESEANNYSKINIKAENGAIGMIASQNSTATNHYQVGNIYMDYTGSKDNHGVIGMYADTGSTIVNDGMIMGQDHSTESSAGTITGMRGQIINQENPPKSKVFVKNNGNIELDIAADGRESKTSLVGMGSWIENEFLDGSMLLSRAGLVYLDNLGKIILNVALTGSGAYNAADEDGTSYLMKGIGGIIGMRADGNTIATNGALIQIDITNSGDNTVENNAAGMQSVHGGDITNGEGGEIIINGGKGNYGMLAVRGEGSNSEFSSDAHSPILTNNGSIEVDSEDGFGMASYNGGGSVNTGAITLKQTGTGIQHNTGTIANSGRIELQQGGVGISMTQKGDIVNELNGEIYIDNTLANEAADDSTGTGNADGTEATETSQQESVGILQENGLVTNNGTITLVNTTGAENTISYGIKSKKGDVVSTNRITITDAFDSYGISADSGKISNSGGITIGNTDGALDGIGYGLKTGSGDITNTATIGISNKNEAYGIATTRGNIVNTGALNLSGHKGGTLSKLAYGIQSARGSVQNNGDITVNDTTDSYGIAADNGSITNSGEISFSNTSNALEGIGYGLKGGNSDITNSGAITIKNKNEAYGIATEQGDITNDALLTINGNNQASKLAYAIKSANGAVTNRADINITNTTDSYGISADNGSITNEGDITLDNTAGSLEGIGYGIRGGNYTPSASSSDSSSGGSSSGGDSSSSGGDTSSSGSDTSSSSGGSSSDSVGASDITNNGKITISDKNQAYGIATTNGNVTNVDSGIILINGAQGALSELGYGIAVGNGSVNNATSIKITNTKDSYAIAVENGDITNSGEIILENTTGALEGIGYGLKTGTGNIVSNANINISNKTEAYGISVDSGNIDSNNEITINNNTGANGSIAYGIKGGNGYINSQKAIVINNANEGYGIYTSNGQVTNNADITLTNNQQTQNKTSYGIKADKGSVYNNGNIYMNVTGDTTQGSATDKGSYGIWGDEANITNATGKEIVFSLRGNGMHTESGRNDNYGTIHMKKGGTGMSTASGNATNQETGTITIDDTGVGMKSGLGNAINNGAINITGSLSTGMESENYAENNSVINVTGYNSKGMSVVADDAEIVNNGSIEMDVSQAQGVQTYGMYGETGVRARMTNNKDIHITGRGYTDDGTNYAYGMYLDHGEALNVGNITIDNMRGIGMQQNSGGRLENAGTITLNYGGIGMGSGGAPDTSVTPNESAAMINQAGGKIVINGGHSSYGMKGEGVATAWNDGSIEVTSEGSYGIYTTEGEGVNTSTVVMNSSKGTGMHSENANTTNKETGVITINGEESVGMSTKDGGGSGSAQTQGAVNEGIINLEDTATSSTGMTVLGSGKATNKNQINVKSTNSSGMLAQGESGTVDNSGTITVTGSESSGMKATAGTATNNKEILIQADDSYGMYADGDTAEIVNGMNGTISIADDNNSKYAMYVKNGKGVNNGTLTFTKDGLIAMYVEKGSIENNRAINLSGTNSVAMYGDGKNNATLTNNAGKDGPLDYDDLPSFTTNRGIIINGEGSTGMRASGNTTATNAENGVITVNGPNSYGMMATGVTLGGENIYGTAINDGIIIVNDSTSEALYADGGVVENGTSGMIYTNGSIAIHVNSGTGTNKGILRNDRGGTGADNMFKAMYVEGGTIDNQGRIVLNGDYSVGMEIGASGTANNSLATSRIEVNGANSIGMHANNGTATNSGTINVKGGAGSVAMQADGGTIINNAGSEDGTDANGALISTVENGILMLVNSGDGINNGVISLDTMGLTAMKAVTGSIQNTGTIALRGNNAVGMETVNGKAENTGKINISGSGSKGMSATGNSGEATNSGSIDVSVADGFAMYANGGTIINSSNGDIKTAGSSAMYVQSGVAKNQGTIENSNNSFHAIHVENGTAENTGSIILDGEDASGIYSKGGTVNNNGGTITMSGSGNTYGINGADGSDVTITNSGNISVASGVGIANNSGSVTNEQKGTIIVNGIGITTVSGSVDNKGKISASDDDAIGMQSTGGGGLTNDGSITVDGSGSRGMSATGGGTIDNNKTMSVSGSLSVGIFSDGGTVTNGQGAILSVSGTDAIGIQVINGGSAINKGELTVLGKYGMYANNSKITNTGTITLENGDYAMYAINGSEALNDQGTIWTGGDDNKWCYADASSSCTNNGQVNPEVTTRTMSLFSAGRILIGPQGNFTSAEIKGNVGINATMIEGSEAVFKNAFTAAKIDDLNVYGTAWFDDVTLVESEDEVTFSEAEDEQSSDTEESNGSAASRTTRVRTLAVAAAAVPAESETVDTSTDTSDEDSSNGGFDKDDYKNYDIIVKKGRLNRILSGNVGIEDRSVLDKIDDAYEAGADSQIFDVLKSAYTNDELATAIKKELGLDFFANFAKQNLDVIKSADRQINTSLFNNQSDKEIRFTTGYDFMSRRQKATAYQTDYEDQAHSIFGMLDKKFNEHFRYGIGVLMSNYTSDYDDDTSSRDELMIQMLLPLSFQFDSTKLISIPRFGMGFGDYTRRTQSGTYEADTTNYYYGITNELRHTIDMGWFGLEPTLEFNVLGMHQDKIKENGALEVDASDSLSIEAGAGLYASKLFEFGDGHNLKLRAGGTIYHELADPYKAQSARLRDAGIDYHINSYDADRTRGVLSLRADYNYRKFNFYSEINKYLETDDAYAINAGMGYKF